jgi:CelD/BcsL family acetyltransferase involved in cellulose biosynthesis
MTAIRMGTALTQTDEHYEISAWKEDHRSVALRHPWGSLASIRDSSATIYQSPEYFDYLQDIEPDALFDILTVKNAGTDAIVGVVPIKRWPYRLQFTFRASALFALEFSSIGILGSEPMIPEDPRAFDQLFSTLARQYPTAQVIYMDAVPAASRLWQHLQSSPTIRSLFHILTVQGFREWHTVPLPRSLDEYNKKLTKKKRYNLMRQERLLQDHCGNPLCLLTIDKEKDLPELFDAMNQFSMEEKFNFVFRKEEYIHSSRHNLLHCYVLKSGNKAIGILLGMKAGHAFKIDRFIYDPSLKKYSPGTSLWQLVLKDLIDRGEFTSVDFGYGLPAYQHRSTNIIQQKGRVLLFRRSLSNHCVVLAYSIYTSAINFLKNKIGLGARLSTPPDG